MATRHDDTSQSSDLQQVRLPGSFVVEPEPRPNSAAGRGRRLGLITAGMAACLAVGLIAGATGRDPVTVPGPTVTMTVAPEPVDTRYGMATREQLATAPIIDPGVQTVGRGGALPGTWIGVPLSADQICHWQRIRQDARGQNVIVAEVLTNGRTQVTIAHDDSRFVSYGCRWVRED